MSTRYLNIWNIHVIVRKSINEEIRIHDINITLYSHQKRKYYTLFTVNYYIALSLDL